MDFEKFVKNVKKIQINPKPLDVLIYPCENGDFDKHGNVFQMCM